MGKENNTGNPGHESAETFLSIENRRQMFFDEIRMQAVSPFEGDEIVGTFFEATAELLDEENPRLQRLVEDYIHTRTDINNGPFAAILFMRVFHHHMRQFDDEYPNFDYTVAKWKDRLAHITQPHQKYDDIAEDLQTRTLQSNKHSRVWGLLLPLIAKQNAGRAEEPQKILEVGHGRLHISRMLALLGHLPGIMDEPLEVYSEKDDSGQMSRVLDSSATDYVNSLAGNEVNLGYALGIDAVLMGGEDHMERVYSDTFLPSELAKDKIMRFAQPKINNFILLELSRPPQVEHVQLDILNPKQARFLEPGSFDIVFLSSVMYQHTEEQRKIELEQCEKVVAEDGLIIVQDQVAIDPEDPEKLKFYPHWTSPWQYNTIAKDMMNPDALQHLINWETNACRKLVFGLGKLSVEGAGAKTLPELLELPQS